MKKKKSHVAMSDIKSKAIIDLSIGLRCVEKRDFHFLFQLFTRLELKIDWLKRRKKC
jgi:hypothetical protein